MDLSISMKAGPVADGTIHESDMSELEKEGSRAGAGNLNQLQEEVTLRKDLIEENFSVDLSISMKAGPVADGTVYESDMSEMEKEGSRAGAGNLNQLQEEATLRKDFIEENFLAWTKHISSNSANSNRSVNDDDSDCEAGVLNLVSKGNADPGLEPKGNADSVLEPKGNADSGLVPKGDADSGLEPKGNADSGLERPSFMLEKNGEDTQDFDITSAQPLNLCTSASRSSATDQDASEITIKQEPADSDDECDDDSEDDMPSNPKKLRIKLAEIKTEPEWDTSSVSTSSKKTASSVEFWCDWSVRHEEARQNRQHSQRDEQDLESLPVHFPPVQNHTNHESETSPKLLSGAALINLKLYQCGVCTEAYDNPAELKPHMMKHSVNASERPVRCGACLKTFRYVSDLMQHTVVHTGERNHECSLCQATFTKASSLKGHMKVHTGERPYQCSYCPSKFKHASHLKEHERTHTGERPYSCEFCQVSYTSSGQLKLHRKIHTGGRQFKCNMCSVEFNQMLHLEIHRRIHTGEKPYECDLCSCRYRYKSSLKSHMLKVHSEDNRLKCDQCVATFNTPEYLAKHMKSHEKNRKTFTCEECSATFLTLISLTHHRWSHTGEKPFKCELCPASFRDTTSYRRHKMVHVGERAFKCQLCCASFRLMSHLSCHMKIHCEQPANSPLPDGPTASDFSSPDVTLTGIKCERHSPPPDGAEFSVGSDFSPEEAMDLKLE